MFCDLFIVFAIHLKIWREIVYMAQVNLHQIRPPIFGDKIIFSVQYLPYPRVITFGLHRNVGVSSRFPSVQKYWMYRTMHTLSKTTMGR